MHADLTREELIEFIITNDSLYSEKMMDNFPISLLQTIKKRIETEKKFYKKQETDK